MFPWLKEKDIYASVFWKYKGGSWNNDKNEVLFQISRMGSTPLDLENILCPFKKEVNQNKSKEPKLSQLNIYIYPCPELGLI